MGQKHAVYDVPAETPITDFSASLMATAERELGAFLTAVRQKSGAQAVARACEYWMQAFEAADLTRSHPDADLRRLTIAAASRLAKD